MPENRTCSFARTKPGSHLRAPGTRGRKFGARSVGTIKPCPPYDVMPVFVGWARLCVPTKTGYELLAGCTGKSRYSLPLKAQCLGVRKPSSSKGMISSGIASGEWFREVRAPIRRFRIGPDEKTGVALLGRIERALGAVSAIPDPCPSPALRSLSLFRPSIRASRLKT